MTDARTVPRERNLPGERTITGLEESTLQLLQPENISRDMKVAMRSAQFL